MIKQDYFILYANCVSVKGYARSMIYDLQNFDYIFIPNALYEILNEWDNRIDLSRVSDSFSQEDKEIIDEYIAFLLHKDMGFVSSDPVLFPSLGLIEERDSELTNAIIRIGMHSDSGTIGKIANQLDAMRCESVQIRFGSMEPNQVLEYMSFFTDSIISTLEILFLEGCPESLPECLMRSNGRIKKIVVYRAAETKRIVHELNVIEYLPHPYAIENCCGVIAHRSMVMNIPFFREAHFHHTCLYKKIYIAENGDVRNCPGSKIIWGNVSNESIRSLLNDKNKTKLWSLTKDKIAICRDCEYRYACMDCRFFIDDVDHPFSRPSGCRYNPYIAKWAGEPGYIPVCACGEYRAGKFRVDKKRLKRLSSESNNSI